MCMRFVSIQQTIQYSICKISYIACGPPFLDCFGQLVSPPCRESCWERVHIQMALALSEENSHTNSTFRATKSGSYQEVHIQDCLKPVSNERYQWWVCMWKASGIDIFEDSLGIAWSYEGNCYILLLNLECICVTQCTWCVCVKWL